MSPVPKCTCLEVMFRHDRTVAASVATHAGLKGIRHSLLHPILQASNRLPGEFHSICQGQDSWERCTPLKRIHRLSVQLEGDFQESCLLSFDRARDVPDLNGIQLEVIDLLPRDRRATLSATDSERLSVENFLAVSERWNEPTSNINGLTQGLSYDARC